MLKLVVLLSVAALAAAKPGYLAYGAPASSSVSQYSTSVVHGSPLAVAPVAVAPVAVAPVGVASVAVHSSGALLDAVHGVPLDTPEVVAARAAHFSAHALPLHHLKKRSLAYAAPVVASYSAPVVSGYSAYSSPLVSAYSSPVVSPYSAPVYSAYSSPVVVAPKAYGVHPW